MTSARRAISGVCALAAVGAAVGGFALRRARAVAEASESERWSSNAGVLRTAATGALDARARELEAEVKRAAATPQLRSALADGVDTATLLDLFETEDWWAPYRSRAAALVAGRRILAVRGDKDLPVPDAETLARAREAGPAHGIVTGVHPVLEAVVSTGIPRQVDAPRSPRTGSEPPAIGSVGPSPTSPDANAIFLVFGAPLDVAGLRVALGAPVLLSDGEKVVAASGPEPQLAELRSAVGREKSERLAEAGAGWQALAIPISAKLWLWAWQPAPAPTSSGASGPLALWAAAAALLLAAVMLVRRGTPSIVPGLAALPTTGSQPQPAAAPAPTTDRVRRGTLAYDTDEMAHRPATLADSGVDVPRVGGGATPRFAHALSTFVPERSRVEPGSNSFGRYRLIDRLGEGGMAEIYTAELHGAEGFRRIYVLKRLRPEIARNRSAVDQFIDEAKLGSSLVHSNIVPVFDFGKVGDEFFMAQEYIIGRDMIRLTQRHMERLGRPLAERLVLYVAHEVLEALAYAHNQTDPAGRPLGLVHRDISPGNIMLTSRGEVKLADFGIVKAQGRLSTTDVGVVKGNVSFMSPEQARGQEVDARSDLFSLGLVVYYCLTSDPLYPGEGTFDQLMKAATGPQTEHLKILRELPPTASRVLTRALAVAPDSRFQTAAEFAAELAPFAVGVKAEAAALIQQLFGEELRKESSI